MTSPQVLKTGWTSIEPADAGWTYVSFAVHGLRVGESVTIAADDHERAYVPLTGSVVARSGDQEWTFGGRASVFDGLAGASTCRSRPR